MLNVIPSNSQGILMQKSEIFSCSILFSFFKKKVCLYLILPNETFFDKFFQSQLITLEKFSTDVGIIYRIMAKKSPAELRAAGAYQVNKSNRCLGFLFVYGSKRSATIFPAQ